LEVNLTIIVTVHAVAFAEKLGMPDFRRKLGYFVAALGAQLVDHALATTGWGLLAAVVFPAVVHQTIA
jgi:hypothetical protein